MVLLGREGPATEALVDGLGCGTTVRIEAGLEIEDGEGLGLGGRNAVMAVAKASSSIILAAFGTDCFTFAAPGFEVDTLAFEALSFVS